MRWALLCLLLMVPSTMAAVSPQQSIPAPGGYGFGSDIDVVEDAAVIHAGSLSGDLFGNGGRPAGSWLYERRSGGWSHAVTYDQECAQTAHAYWHLSADRLIEAAPCGAGRAPEGVVETGVNVVDPINNGHVKRWSLDPATGLSRVTYGTSEDRVQYALTSAAGDGWWAATWETSSLLRTVDNDGQVTEDEVVYQHWGLYVPQGAESRLAIEEISDPDESESYAVAADDGILHVAGGGLPPRAFRVVGDTLSPVAWTDAPNDNGRDGRRAAVSGGQVTIWQRDSDLSWGVRERFTIDVPAPLSTYGSIDIQGDVIALGLRGHETCDPGGFGEDCTPNVHEPGHVHIYHRSQSGVWLLHEDVIGPGIYGHRFGNEVAVAGGQVLIGAPGADDDRGMYGTVYVRTMNQWPTAAYHWPDDPAPFTFDKITFTSTSTDPENQRLTHSWDFDGDGIEDATGSTATWSWDRPGIFPVTLNVTDTQEGRDAVTHFVFIRNRAPSTDFFPTPTPVWRTADTLWENYAFDPDGAIVSCAWDFGDGATSTACEPRHTYPAQGVYTVTLITCDDGDEQEPPQQAICTQRSRDIQVFNHKPVVEITVDGEPISGEPFTVHATASDPDGTVVSQGWSDGSQGSPRTVTAVRPGILRLGYEATDDEGDRTVVWKDIDIANRAPTADFDLPTDHATQIPLPFTDASHDPDGRIVSWAWDFGDGNSSADRQPRHSYDAKGTYTVRLEVRDDFGVPSGPIEKTLVIDNDAPVPRIGASVRDGMVEITDLSFDPDGTVVSRSWYLDDEPLEPTFPWITPLPDPVQRLRLQVTDDRGTTQNTTLLLGVVADLPAPEGDTPPDFTLPPPADEPSTPVILDAPGDRATQAGAPLPDAGNFPWFVLIIAFLLVSVAATLTMTRLRRNPRN